MRRSAALLVGLALSVCAGPVSGQDRPPPAPALIIDEGRLLDLEAEAALMRTLAELERETGRRLSVVTVADLGGLEIQDYGDRLGRAWNLDGTGADAVAEGGAALIVAPDAREVRLQVGRGLKAAIPDAVAARIILDDILPAFRVGGYQRGLRQGTAALAERMRADAPTAGAASVIRSRPMRVTGTALALTLGVLAFFALGLLKLAPAGGRPRRGPGGATRVWSERGVAARSVRSAPRDPAGPGQPGGGASAGW